ncbi:MAG: serine kinase [Paracoccaceae bacterium]|jgi:HPr kinase/phosphorylase|nr:MAG: hypothetical protein ABR89_04325 [Rhodobacter sp. BACL10 MAG-120910-bin24]KRO87763.1 MAG: hypothetical protein ABR99_03895 [Rhodobacter sp. BACL10 MAG-121220-bin24]MDA0355329.1 serine kinase [Pseudomonadota bacterium]MDO7568665.1 serine kinase [Paracoccaceae bacterium]HAG26668.1 serine kinase [Rhodobacter sp.]|tara:strand:- start:1445 stop:1876 length:432 start_codon:yes stop_codon:yes gene_type:complete
MMQDTVRLHATTVSYEGRALVIKGPSGSGKSSLALALMALGAELVADDQTVLTRDQGYLRPSCPHALIGMIEARGIGILRADMALGPVAVDLVLDLGQRATERLPHMQNILLCGIDFPLLSGHDDPYFMARVFHALKFGFANL